MNLVTESGMTFQDVSWVEFTRLAKSFHLALPNTSSIEEIEAGFKCVGLAYLGLTTTRKDFIEETAILLQAPILIKMLANNKLNREIELSTIN